MAYFLVWTRVLSRGRFEHTTFLFLVVAGLGMIKRTRNRTLRTISIDSILK